MDNSRRNNTTASSESDCYHKAQGSTGDNFYEALCDGDSTPHLQQMSQQRQAERRWL